MQPVNPAGKTSQAPAAYSFRVRWGSVLENLTIICEPPVMAAPLGRLDINLADGSKTNAPGAASVAHITEADTVSQLATITLVIENMFQRCIVSFQCANDSIQVF